MATLIWFIVWLVQGTPNLQWFGSWNDWAVALLGCIIFDVFSGREAGARRDAGHLSGFQTRPQEYEERETRFFDGTLLGAE